MFYNLENVNIETSEVLEEEKPTLETTVLGAFEKGFVNDIIVWNRLSLKGKNPKASKNFEEKVARIISHNWNDLDLTHVFEKQAINKSWNSFVNSDSCEISLRNKDFSVLLSHLYYKMTGLPLHEKSKRIELQGNSESNNKEKEISDYVSSNSLSLKKEKNSINSFVKFEASALPEENEVSTMKEIDSILKDFSKLVQEIEDWENAKLARRAARRARRRDRPYIFFC